MYLLGDRDTVMLAKDKTILHNPISSTKSYAGLLWKLVVSWSSDTSRVKETDELHMECT